MLQLSVICLTFLSMKSPHIFPIDLGVSSYAFTWAIGVLSHQPKHPLDAMELLEVAAQLKCKRLQIADNLPVHLLSADKWGQLTSKAQQLGIQLELGIRGLKAEKLQAYLSLAKACQSPFLRVVIDEKNYEPDHETIIEILRKVLPDFKDAGIPIAIENHDRFRAYELVNIIEATDSNWVGICLDTANSLGADEGIYEVARILAPYTLNLHIKDYLIRRFDHQMGFTILGTPAGQGQTPIKWLLELLTSYGNCKSATLEIWSEPLDNLEANIRREKEWVEKSVVYLSTMLETLNV